MSYTLLKTESFAIGHFSQRSIPPDPLTASEIAEPLVLVKMRVSSHEEKVVSFVFSSNNAILSSRQQSNVCTILYELSHIYVWSWRSDTRYL